MWLSKTFSFGQPFLFLKKMLQQLKYAEYKPQLLKLPVFFILEDVNSYDNVGLIFRSSDAFGISKLILTGSTPTPPHKLIGRYSGGCDKHIAFEYFEKSSEAIEFLKKEGYFIAALEITNKSSNIRVKNFRIIPKLAIIVGSERVGIKQETLNACHESIHIESLGFGLSINVAIAASICMFEISEQHK